MILKCPKCNGDVDFGNALYAVASEKDTCEHCGEKFQIEHECAHDGEVCIEWLIGQGMAT
jgi:hypothetical protein